MFSLLDSALTAVCSSFQTPAALQLEILALGHQIHLLRRSQRGRVHLVTADRLFWTRLMHLWTGWRCSPAMVKPATVIAWHYKGFRLYLTWKSRRGRSGRPQGSREIRDLIRNLSLANPLSGAPCIHDELLKIWIQRSQATVAKFMERHQKPPSQTWRTFLDRHLKQVASGDSLVVPTVNFGILFTFAVLAHHRHRVIHFNVTAKPTSERTVQQIGEAFAWETSPRHPLHDRDSLYGGPFRQGMRGMSVREVLTTRQLPRQNSCVQRPIRSIRRRCWDHIVVFGDSSPRLALKSYLAYYHGARTWPSRRAGSEGAASRSRAALAKVLRVNSGSAAREEILWRHP
ncbi:MAG TPA: integrase [Terriglobia bacterium]|nr:integrase [Terriglobia bacterium]